MATSVRRSVLRASSMLATLAQAVSSTNPTATSSARICPLIPPTTWYRNGLIHIVVRALVFGYVLRNGSARVFSSDSAACQLTPGSSRATPSSQCMPRPRSSGTTSGVQTSIWEP